MAEEITPAAGSGRTPLAILGRGLLVAFVLLHVSSIVWRVIPAGGFERDDRTTKLPGWFTGLEQRLFAWKKRVEGRWLPSALTAYTYATGTWQRWLLFAPSPIKEHNWFTVYAVVGWRDPGPFTSKEKTPWKDGRQPDYEPVPLYKSYDGELSQRMKGSGSGYTHDAKMVEQLLGNDRALAAFADYWGRVFEEKTGKRPLGIHVIHTKAEVSRLGPDGLPTSPETTTRVAWYRHYGSK
jgi:hypothetical protein